MRKSLLVLALFAMVMLPIGAFADSASFSFNIANPGLAPTNTSYGTISLNLVDSTHITFDIQMFNGVPTGSSTSTDYKLSDFGFNRASTFVGGTLSCTSITAAWTQNCGASGNLDGLGSYAYIVAGANGANAPGDHLQFTVTISGNTFSSVYNLVGSTTGGNCPAGCLFAGEVFPFQNRHPVTTTGFVGVTKPTTKSPEPASMALLGVGLLGLGSLVRRRK